MKEVISHLPGALLTVGIGITHGSRLEKSLVGSFFYGGLGLLNAVKFIAIASCAESFSDDQQTYIGITVLGSIALNLCGLSLMKESLGNIVFLSYWDSVELCIYKCAQELYDDYISEKTLHLSEGLL